MARLGPLPDAPRTVKVRLIYIYNNRPAFNVFHMEYSGTAPNDVTTKAVADAVYAQANTNLKPLVNNQVQLTTVEVTDLASRTGSVGTNTTGWLGTSGSANPTPNSVAMCVSLQTAYRYRGGHARMYLPGQLNSNIANGTNWTGAWVTTTKAGMAAWLAGMNAISTGGSSWTLVMTSYYTHDSNHLPIYHPGGPVNYPVTLINVHTRVDSQRRRLGKETT